MKRSVAIGVSFFLLLGAGMRAQVEAAVALQHGHTAVDIDDFLVGHFPTSAVSGQRLLRRFPIFQQPNSWLTGHNGNPAKQKTSRSNGRAL